MPQLLEQLSCPDVGAPQDLRAWIAARLPAGASLTGLRLFCTADLPDRVLCLISFSDAVAAEIAHALHGQSFGFDSAVVSLPVGSRFLCRSRQSGAEFTARDCTCCPGGRPAASRFELD